MCLPPPIWNPDKKHKQKGRGLLSKRDIRNQLSLPNPQFGMNLQPQCVYPRDPMNVPAGRANRMLIGKTVKEKEDSRLGKVRKHRTALGMPQLHSLGPRSQFS